MNRTDEAIAAESILRATGRPLEAEHVLGPMLRYAGTKNATPWLETNRPCEVEIHGHHDRTFCVEGHHYGLLLVDDLQPASSAVEWATVLAPCLVGPFGGCYRLGRPVIAG